MKLRNKKTGEIMDDAQYRNYSLSDGFGLRMNGKEWEYHSLAELNEDWEDYKEPEYWYINEYGFVMKADNFGRDTLYDKSRKNFGNYFLSREEAERAVEKLKAWKRMKDNEWLHENWGDLTILFGGEE